MRNFAEKKGFEPLDPLRDRRFSKPSGSRVAERTCSDFGADSGAPNALERFRARLAARYPARPKPEPIPDTIRTRWAHMVQRCQDEADPRYDRYGGRGISVCRAWLGPRGLRAFFEHVGHPPTPKHSIGRIDNDRGYEPGNVRWETWTEQQNNRCSNVRVTVGDVTLTYAEWGRRTGWAPEVAVSTPPGVAKKDAHERAGIPPTGPWKPRPRKRADGSRR
jgi:hypothetical protein